MRANSSGVIECVFSSAGVMAAGVGACAGAGDLGLSRTVSAGGVAMAQYVNCRMAVKRRLAS